MRSFPGALIRLSLLTAGVHLAAITAPGIAWAAPPQAPPAAPAAAPSAAPPDAITLKNGGILRGTIVDAIPNDHARIELATHEIATVAWADIARIDRGGEKTTVAPAPAPAPAPALPPATASTTPPTPPGTVPAEKSLVTVHIEGPDDVQLEQDTTGQDDWAVVCSGTCDRSLSTAYWYRVSGGGIKASSQFSLHGQPGSKVTLNVSPASKGWFIAGLIAIPVGGIIAYIGLVLGVVGSAASDASSTAGSNQAFRGSSDVAATGWTMLAVGGLAAVGGLVLTISNWKTGVTQDLAAKTPTPSSDAALRLPTPTWREPGVEARTLPPAWSMPVLSGSF